MYENREIVQKKIIEESLTFLKNKSRGLLDVTMRVGKTFIISDIINQMGFSNSKILICYPDNKILDSWKSTFNTKNLTLTDVTYSNFSSIKKYVNVDYDLLILDEIHELSENEIKHSIKISNNSKYTIGLTGTLTEKLELTMDYLNMTHITKYTKEEAIQDNIVADYNITIHLVNLDTKVKTKNSKGKYVSEKQKYDSYTYVIERMRNENRDYSMLLLNRNRLSCNSLAKKNKTLSLIQELKDKRVIIFTGQIKAAEELKLPTFHSKSKNDKNLVDFNNKKFNHLSLVNSGKVGVNYTDLDSIILSNFVGKHETNRQLLDRSAKLDYHNKIADLHIICLNEDNEIKKLKKTLVYYNENKIKWKLP